MKTAPSQAGMIEKPQKCRIQYIGLQNAPTHVIADKQKGSYAHVLIVAAWLLDESSCMNCAVCELIKPVPRDSRSKL